MPELIGVTLIIVLLVIVLLVAAIRWICEKFYEVCRIISGEARREEKWRIKQQQEYEEQQARARKKQARTKAAEILSRYSDASISTCRSKRFKRSRNTYIYVLKVCGGSQHAAAR